MSYYVGLYTKPSFECSRERKAFTYMFHTFHSSMNNTRVLTAWASEETDSRVKSTEMISQPPIGSINA